MPIVSIAARLLRSDFQIPANHWFAVYENDAIELISDPMAAVLLKGAMPEPIAPKPKYHRSRTNGTTKLSWSLTKELKVLAERKRPMPAGKHNASGQFSRLKQLGYAANEGGRWSITEDGLAALELENEHAGLPPASQGDATSDE